jgi:hypothetical protein
MLDDLASSTTDAVVIEKVKEIKKILEG